MEKIFVIVVVGPTASGKTGLGVKLAERYMGEVVSADSMQIYKKMRIATARPTAQETRGIPHHLMNYVEPDESYSVARFKTDAVKEIRDIASRGKIPVIVGGTGLYVDALIENISYFESGSDSSLRDALTKKAENNGTAELYKKLLEIDPQSAEKIHFNNTKKIVRALEIYYQTGKTITEQNEASHSEESFLSPVFIGLTARNRRYLYDRINRRVDMMIEDGLIDEAKAFYSEYSSGTANQAIGYKELLPYLKGEKSLDEAVENLKMQTRRYAKRQLTWFRRNEKINWLCIDEFNEEELLKKAEEIIDSRRTT